ncbi:flippase [Fibrella sp. HMF5335]|uniref:Flippase n=1 Tax=Fibrella rubiginis TaxID=2817060 RepID=A0A939K410_9BACT|nr:flippase [Fibrella rubiginis]MBO0937944.1 flippase [Fibrella rubiginis]
MSIPKPLSSQLFVGLRNAGWLFFDKIFRMATGLIVGVWLARYLGPEQFGVLNYAYVFPLIMSAFVGLGINPLLVSQIPVASNHIEIDRLVLTSVALKMFAGIIAFGIILVTNYYIHSHLSQLFVLITISASGLLFQGFDAVDIYFQSIRRVQYSIIPKVIAFVLATLARLYGLTHGLGLTFFVLVMVVELATSYVTIYLLFFKQRRLPFLQWSFHKSTAYRLLRMAWPLMVAEFFIFIYMRLDQVMIKYLANSAELGKYSAALRISEAWYFVAGALTASFYPGIIILRSQNYSAYLQRYQYLLNLLVAIGISIGLAFNIAAEPISQLLYGAQYVGVGNILAIHIWTGIFVFLGVGSNNWYVVENLQTFLLWRTVAGVLINVSLNILLIPHYGALGASIATLLAQMVASYLTNGFYRRTKEVFILQTNALLFIPKWLNNRVKRTFLE